MDLKHLDPAERQYHLTCELKFMKKSYQDEQSAGKLGQIEREFVLLEPVESSEAYAFFGTWLGTPEKRVEVLIRIDHPFHQYARCAIMHPKTVDKESELESYHLFLMSHGLSLMMLAKKSLNGSKISIITCAESDDHPDGCPTDGVGEGDELHSGTRKTVKTGLETDGLPDRYGKPAPKLEG